MTKPLRLATIYSTGKIILPYDDAVKVMAALKDAEALEGWGDSTYAISSTCGTEMKSFPIEDYHGIKKAQLLGTPYDDYKEQLEKINAKSIAEGC